MADMKKRWVDPAKHPPKPETLDISGDFGRFTDMMRRIVNKPKGEEKQPSAASPAPAAT